MLFNSSNFALFLCVAYLVFLVTPGRLKALWLLAASYLFYGFSSASACAALVCISLLTYWGGIWIDAARDHARKQIFRLLLLVGMLLAALVYFKFVPLIADELHRFGASVQAGRPECFLLFVPLGYSYYIFQAVGYLVDIVWGEARAKNLRDFLLFMAFFPKVIMGPIERGHQLLPQIEEIPAFRFDYDRFREGLLMFAWGLFKKLVVADHLAQLVNAVYASPADASGLPVAVAAAAFAFQLYADFSGYTDMALGVGKLFGIELTQNFKRPFMATSIPDFWKRWHLSFSRWIADYVYLPLSIRLRFLGATGLGLTLMITFILLGIWHGNGWTFVVFGIVQGLYMVGSTFTLRARDGFWKRHGQAGQPWLIASRRVATFGMVAFSLIFFRADSLPHAVAIVRSLNPHASLHDQIGTLLQYSPLRLAVLVVFMELVEHFVRSGEKQFAWLVARPLWLRWPAYIGLTLAILCGGVFTSAQRFIYMAF